MTSLGALEALENACSRKAVYDTLSKIRRELEELRTKCGHVDNKDKLRRLKERCERQMEEIAHLKELQQESEERIKLLTSLLCVQADGSGDATLDLPKEHSGQHWSTQNVDELLEQLWASEKRAREMESCVNRLNLQLTKKVLELNELQLQYSEQAKKMMDMSRESYEAVHSSSNLSSRQTWDNSEVSYGFEAF